MPRPQWLPCLGCGTPVLEVHDTGRPPRARLAALAAPTHVLRYIKIYSMKVGPAAQLHTTCKWHVQLQRLDLRTQRCLLNLVVGIDGAASSFECFTRLQVAGADPGRSCTSSRLPLSDSRP
jgi:hypothetical protein